MIDDDERLNLDDYDLLEIDENDAPLDDSGLLCGWRRGVPFSCNLKSSKNLKHYLF